MIQSRERIIFDMCLTMRHDFGLDKTPDYPLSSGISNAEREVLTLTMAQLYEHHIADLRQAAVRYEKLRKLNPNQFGQLFDRNLHGEGTFDELVDQLENS